MKNLYSRFYKALVSFVLIISLHSSAKAQILTAGDIAFTGYTSGGAVDSFSFVLLVNIPSGTVINFTDDAWLGAAFSGGEETVTWTSTAAMTAGREITIFGTTAVVAGPPISPGTVTGTPINLTTTGDQVLAYQGLAASPTFISGIHMNVYSTVPSFDCGNTTAATWDPVCVGSGGSFCIKPSSLTTGVDAVWIGTFNDGTTERDNARFNCTGPLTTVAQIRAAVNNSANWVTDQLTPDESYNPSACSFLGTLAVSFVSFTGKLNTDKTVSLQWKVAEQQNIQQFIVEESTDGTVFKLLGSVIAGNNNTTYTYVDPQLDPGNNYYRLKVVEQSGKISYSNTININLKSPTQLDIFPNPVSDKVTIRQSEGLVAKTALLTDQQGKLLQRIQLTNLQQVINMAGFSDGIYYLKLDNGTVFKLVKRK